MHHRRDHSWKPQLRFWSRSHRLGVHLIKFEVKFIKITKNEKTGKTEFIDEEDNTLESVDNFRDIPDGALFPIINLLERLDLTKYQIFNSIDKKNYMTTSSSMHVSN